MKIISINTNGIRAAARKGFFTWLAQQDADAICIQETKAQEPQLSDAVFAPEGYHRFLYDAQKPGYSGVALYLRSSPQQIIYGLGWDPADSEGRYIQADYANLSIISLYLPSGSSSEARQEIKFKFLDRFLDHLKDIRGMGREFVICGDWNIAHTKQDIKNWRGNQKNSGFLPEERAWLDEVFGPVGFVDAFREVNQEDEQYTWWSNRGQAWAKNVGWRIDYQVVTPGLKNKILNAEIYKDERFSDHAPLIMEYDFKIKPGFGS